MKFFKRTDVIILTIAVIACIVIGVGYRYFWTEGDVYVQVYYEDKLVHYQPMGRVGRIFVEEAPEVVLLANDTEVYFERSDCPDKVCVNAGKLKRAGEGAACLPNKVIVKLVAKLDAKGQLDAVVG